MSIANLPIRTPPLDTRGNFTRPWITAFQALGAGSAASGGVIEITVAGGNALIDLSQGTSFSITLDGTAITVLAPAGTGTSFILYLDQDASGGRAAPTFTGGDGGFASDTATRISNIPFDTTLSTTTALTFAKRGTTWLVIAATSGGALA